MKLKNTTIQTLFIVLQRLDPALEVVNQQQQPKPRSSFQFKPKVAYALARNYRKLKACVDDIDYAKRSAIKALATDESQERLTPAQVRQLEKQIEPLLQEEVELDLHQIQIADLELEKNPIALELLGELVDLILVGDFPEMPSAAAPIPMPPAAKA